LQIETDVEVAFAGIDPRLKEGITTTVYDGECYWPAASERANESAGGAGSPVGSPASGPCTTKSKWVPQRYLGATKDAWITARLRSEFMLDADIRSGNYTIETEDGSVYLIGSARSPAELDRATRISRYIPGVRRVVSYVELRPGNPVAQQPSQPTGSINSINAAL